MSKAARFTQADVKRAVAGLLAAGERVVGAKINPDGSVTVLTGEPIAANDTHNPLDRVLSR